MTLPAIDIEKLAPAERLQLIEELWESLCRQPQSVPLTDAHRRELDRRLDELHDGRAQLVSRDEAERRLRDRRA